MPPISSSFGQWADGLKTLFGFKKMANGFKHLGSGQARAGGAAPGSIYACVDWSFEVHLVDGLLKARQ
jgi:hypothetical protein